MTDEQLLERIVLDPQVMVGKPVIRGTRLTVEHIVNLLAHGASAADIVQEYHGLHPRGRSSLPALRDPLAGRFGFHAARVRTAGVNAFSRRRVRRAFRGSVAT